MLQLLSSLHGWKEIPKVHFTQILLTSAPDFEAFVLLFPDPGKNNFHFFTNPDSASDGLGPFRKVGFGGLARQKNGPGIAVRSQHFAIPESPPGLADFSRMTAAPMGPPRPENRNSYGQFGFRSARFLARGVLPPHQEA